MLDVTIRDLGETVIVCSMGRIVLGEIETLREAVLSQCRRRTVVLDLARVDAVDGSGIGLLVFLHEWASNGGIDLRLMNPTRLVRELLELTNLDSVFTILSLEDAISSGAVVIPATDGTGASL